MKSTEGRGDVIFEKGFVFVGFYFAGSGIVRCRFMTSNLSSELTFREAREILMDRSGTLKTSFEAGGSIVFRS